MTKIQIDDGKSKQPAKARVSTPSAAAKKVKKSSAKKSPARKITVNKSEPKKIEVKKAPKKISVKTTRKIAVNAVSSSSTHSIVQKSTTLSRRYVHRPVSAVELAKKKAAEAEAAKKAAEAAAAKKLAEEEAARKAAEEEAARKAAEAEAAKKAAEAAAAKKLAEQEAAKQIKVSSRRSAIQAKAKAKAEEKAAKKAARAAAKEVPKTSLAPEFKSKHRGRRIFFALACSAATVGALVAFVHFNMPDVSVRVAAMQTGIEASYPTFVPRNYSLAGVSTDKDGVIIMNFTGPDDAGFTLSEEKSTWDSTALLNNYVKKTYPSDYATLREQGITIYTRGQSATWVSGGILYKIEASGKNLTKEQIKNIATSL